MNKDHVEIEDQGGWLDSLRKGRLKKCDDLAVALKHGCKFSKLYYIVQICIMRKLEKGQSLIKKGENGILVFYK